eukprot:gene3091-2073_t
MYLTTLLYNTKTQIRGATPTYHNHMTIQLCKQPSLTQCKITETRTSKLNHQQRKILLDITPHHYRKPPRKPKLKHLQIKSTTQQPIHHHPNQSKLSGQWQLTPNHKRQHATPITDACHHLATNNLITRNNLSSTSSSDNQHKSPTVSIKHSDSNLQVIQTHYKPIQLRSVHTVFTNKPHLSKHTYTTTTVYKDLNSRRSHQSNPHRIKQNSTHRKHLTKIFFIYYYKANRNFIYLTINPNNITKATINASQLTSTLDKKHYRNHKCSVNLKNNTASNLTAYKPHTSKTQINKEYHTNACKSPANQFSIKRNSSAASQNIRNACTTIANLHTQSIPNYIACAIRKQNKRPIVSIASNTKPVSQTQKHIADRHYQFYTNEFKQSTNYVKQIPCNINNQEIRTYNLKPTT